MRSVAPRIVRLDSRLSLVMELLCSAGCVIDCIADIGCDHGFLSAAMLQQNEAMMAYACDISRASVAKATALAHELGLSDRLIAVQADGLKGLDALVNDKRYAIAICGMGGELIARLLEADKATAMAASIIVMQPMRGEAELRGYLHQNGYTITNERIALDDGRYYQLIAAKAGEAEPIPDWFPRDFYRFGWVMAQKNEQLLLPLLKHYRAVYQLELERATRKGSSPQRLIDEIHAVDIIISRLVTGGTQIGA